MMKLLDIVKDSSFIITRNRREVMNSFYFVMNKLTGQNLSKSVNEKYYCSIMYKLIQKYIKRKVNKIKFLKLEEVWLERQEVNLQKSLKWTDRQT